MRLRTSALALVLPAVLSAACGGSSGGSVASGSGGSSGPGAFEVKTTNFAFEPATLQGSPGQKATVHLTNSSGTKHNFTLEDQKIDQDIESGKDVTVSITFPASGQLTFVCEYHKARGMTGTLVVGGAAPSPAATTSSGGGGNGSSY
jgi:plastocyanin